jgi:hypothetical protein
MSVDDGIGRRKMAWHKSVHLVLNRTRGKVGSVIYDDR